MDQECLRVTRLTSAVEDLGLTTRPSSAKAFYNHFRTSCFFKYNARKIIYPINALHTV
jgi:hypothetical protein